MNTLEALENWSVRACEALQEFCDQAQEAAGNPYGEDQLLDIRLLLVEHHRIVTGLEAWQIEILKTKVNSGTISFGDHDNENSIS